MKTYNEFISEAVTNPKLMESYLQSLILKISKWCIKNNISYEQQVIYRYPNSYFKFSFHLYTDDSIRTKISKYLETLKKNMLNYNVILSYKIGKSFEVDTYYLTVYLKNIILKRIIPDRYVYHVSPRKNRESILLNGLVLKNSSESKWDAEYAYPKSIFAMNGVDTRKVDLWQRGIGDVWRIDTKKLSNKWWDDLNIGDKSKAIMTFDPIPPKYLKLSKKSIDLEELSERELDLYKQNMNNG
jgi:hypothetical protein